MDEKFVSNTSSLTVSLVFDNEQAQQPPPLPPYEQNNDVYENKGYIHVVQYAYYIGNVYIRYFFFNSQFWVIGRINLDSNVFNMCECVPYFHFISVRFDKSTMTHSISGKTYIEVEGERERAHS